MALSHAFLSNQKDRLLSDKERIEHDLARFTTQDGDSFKVIWNEKGAGDEDNADESRDYADALALERTLSSERASIIEALKHINEGTYGRCTSCGNDIAEPRLEARPMATLCVSCQERQER